MRQQEEAAWAAVQDVLDKVEAQIELSAEESAWDAAAAPRAVATHYRSVAIPSALCRLPVASCHHPCE